MAGRPQRRIRGALHVYPRKMGSGANWWWCNVPGQGRRALNLACADVSREEAHRIACERFAAGGLAARKAGAAAEATIEEVIESFSREQKGRYKPRTWHSMSLRLSAVQEWLAEQKIVRASQVTDETVARWMAARAAAKVSNATINRALIAMRVCMRWASRRDPPLCPPCPFERVPRLREVGRQPHPMVPSPEEWQRLVAEVLNEPVPEHYHREVSRTRHQENTRGAALLIASAVETGFRFDELRHQRVEDVRSNAVIVAAHSGWSPKSWHERTVPCSKETAGTLRAFIAWRDAARGLNGSRLALGEHWVNEYIDAAWARARLPGEPPRMHDARRTFATAHVRAGVGLDRVRQLLGHRDVQTTERYLGRYRSDVDTPVATLGVAAVLSAPFAEVIPMSRTR